MNNQQTPGGEEDKKGMSGAPEKQIQPVPSIVQEDPESDTAADVTPRNIDPFDKNSAEPHITDEENESA